MNDNQIIPDLAANIPGVNGAFLYEEGQGILTVQGNLQLQNTALCNIAEKIVRNYSLAGSLFSDCREMFIRFQHLTLFVCRLAPKRWLHVFYDSGMSQFLLQQSISEALRVQGIEGKIFSGSGGQNASARYVSSDSLDKDEVDDFSSLIAEQPELAKPLSIMKEELTTIIGPIAEVVFTEAVDEWLTAARPSMSTLGKLAEIIEEEIGSADMINAFRARLLNQLNITRVN